MFRDYQTVAGESSLACRPRLLSGSGSVVHYFSSIPSVCLRVEPNKQSAGTCACNRQPPFRGLLVYMPLTETLDIDDEIILMEELALHLPL